MESVSQTGSSTDASAGNGVTRHRANHRGVRWTILPGWQDDILGTHAPKWSDLENDDRATLIKSNANRTVWRIEMAGRSLFVKRSRARTLVGRVRKLLGISPGRREWRSAALAKARSVPTVEYVAFGRTARDEFVVTKSLDNAHTLDETWSAAINVPSAAERKRGLDALTVSVAQLLAQAHRGGFFHGDDHPGNVLVSTGNEGARNAIYLDMQRSRIARSTNARAVVHSIAQLHQWFQTRASRSQRWRFLQAYCLNRCDGDKHESAAMARRLLPRIMNESSKQLQTLWAKRDRRILSGTNRYFARLKLEDGSRVIATLRFRRRDLAPPPGVPDRSVDQWRRLLASARSDRDDLEGTSPGPISSSSRRIFVTGHRLRHRDLSCRWPVALIERGSFSGKTTARVWQAKCPPTLSLVDACDDLSKRDPSRRAVLRSLARTLSKMSQRGAYITAMSDDTFGVVEGSDDVIIDNPACIRLARPDPHRQLIATLRALYAFTAKRGIFRQTDAVRLLRALPPGDWKSLWRSVADASKSQPHPEGETT